MTPQSVIDAWRPVREDARPIECDHRSGCWVVDPFGAVTNASKGPCCKLCGGRIGSAISHQALRPPHYRHKKPGSRWRNRHGSGLIPSK